MEGLRCHSMCDSRLTFNEAEEYTADSSARDDISVHKGFHALSITPKDSGLIINAHVEREWAI